MSVALLFPGQGAQNVGMGGPLLERSEIARQLFAQASDILSFDISDLCQNGPEDQIHKTEFSQPALFVHSFAALKQLEAEQPDLLGETSCVAGLSLGEYTAVAAAGGISFEDGVRLVRIRGQAMQAAADATPSGMASILGLDLERLEELCAGVSSDLSYARPANLLCPGNIAISGHLEAIEAAEKACTEAGAMRTIRLQVAGAFHTEIMRPAVAALEEALENATFSRTTIPVLSNVDAACHQEPDEIKGLLAKQVVSPVLWEKSLRQITDSGLAKRCIEVGTGRVLAGTLKRVARKFPCENYGDS
ncbi:MAG: ACP S-malonyltransferase [Aureliella sp.]